MEAYLQRGFANLGPQGIPEDLWESLMPCILNIWRIWRVGNLRQDAGFGAFSLDAG